MSLAGQADTCTFPKLLARNARIWGERPGMREKDRGIWRTYTWRECEAQVRELALGLAALGFRRGDKLSVIGDNRVRLYWAQLAAQALGGVAVPVYQDSIAAELAYVLKHADVAVVVAEDQEQADKILSLRGELPALRELIYDDPRGMGGYQSDILRSYAETQSEGRAFDANHPGRYDRELAQGGGDDIAMIAYTSGTTGVPKGAMLSHRNLIATMQALAEVEDVRSGDDWLCYLPMAWVGDAAYTLGLGLVAGLVASCPEGPETVRRDLRELGPDALLAPPRIWESMLSGLEVKAADATPLKRLVFEGFRALAARRELLASEGKPVPLALALAYRLGEQLVYRPVRDQLGLRNARWCYSGGAPLGADTFRFFRSFGVNLKQIYGATESSALVALQRDGEADPNTVGRTLPGAEVRLDERGEVLVRGPGVFRGYYKQEEATREALTAEGWLRTGDAGLIDPRGHLAIIDRAKDVGKLAGGAPFAPQFVENKLKYSPYIREAVAFGDQRLFVAAMISIDLETVGSWAERRGLAYTSFMDLSRKSEAAELIYGEVVKCNATLPAPLRVRRFLLLAKELEADDAEMTRTRKVRRRFVAQKYAPVIEALYGGRDAVTLSMEITYEDGRKTTMETAMTIHELREPEAAGRAA